MFQVLIGEENAWQAGDYAFQSDSFYSDGVTPLPNLSIGAQNVFNEFGPIDIYNLDGTVGSGNTYESGNPYGNGGGFWYVRVRAEFE